ncbi:kinase-like protein, partial [Zopfia rhizophila CBS 207.26]
NILLTGNGVIKLADFGLSRSFEKSQRPITPKVGTLWHASPEVLLGGKIYTTAVDMWAAGLTIGQLLPTDPLLPGDRGNRHQLDLIIKLI